MRVFRDYLRSAPSTKRAVTGLFGIEGLTSANGLTQFAKSSLSRAQSIAQELRTPTPVPKQRPGALEIRKLDELSDTLCKVVDMAAFLRIAHPSPKMADAAQEVHELLFGFMNELNTSRELYHLVEVALQDQSLPREERKVGEILRHDFLKSGIQFDADPKQQNRFVELSNNISVTGQYFLMGCGAPQPESLILTPSELAGVSPALLLKLSKFGSSSSLLQGKIEIPSSQPHVAEHILTTATSEETRRKVWRYLRSASDTQIRLLEGVLQSRQELAELAGYNSYANYELSDKMMHSAANVDQFLTSLATTVKPLAHSELQRLGGPVAPWDYAYYLSKYHSKIRRTVSAPTFELANVFSGINDLVSTLYGLRFEPAEVDVGEVWTPEVRKLDVYDGSEKVGTIYCDLLSREGKQPNPAHFTIQCARQKFPSEERQLPIIALVCDFEETGGKNGGIQLQYHEVETLFHEMGHAIHSMIGRTKLHNVAGTRCATDFVELPSILFEKFVSHPAVLESMKPGLDASLFLAKRAKIDAATEHWETWHQLGLSFLDQALHSEKFVQAQWSSSAVANEVTAKHTLFDKVPASQQFTQQFAHFGHLVSYGATYYSYLFDRCLASMTWKLLFQDRKLWDNGGHKFKQHVLQWGGSKDPQECIESLFGKELDHGEVAASLVAGKKAT